MVLLVVSWLALSVIAALAFMFGSGVGYRRGLEQGSSPRGSADVAPDLDVDIRLPDDAERLR